MYWRVEPAAPRMRFSAVEVREILIAMAAMTLAFTMAQLGGVAGLGFFLDRGGGLAIAFVVLASFIAVVTAFLFHELAHKALAQRYGCLAEFRYWPMGLVLGVMTAALGFMFAAPGAVVIAGYVTPRQNLRISAAGPATNLVIGGGFLGLAAIVSVAATRFVDPASASLVAILIASVAFVNLFLAFFNLIPFPPLDGSKVFAISKPTWVAMIAATAALYVAGLYLRVFS